MEDRTRGTDYLEVLLRYLSNSAEQVSVEELQETVDEFLEKGGDIMPTIVQQIRTEVKNEFENEKQEIAKRLIMKGMDMDTIAEITGISREKLEQLTSDAH